MHVINSKYDVILTYSPIIEVTGHIFECFDYYLFLRLYYKAGILFFCGLNWKSLKILFESKYNISFDDIKQDIIYINDVSPAHKKLIISFGKNTVVIVTDGNIKSLEYNNIILATNKLYGFLCKYDDFHKMKYNKQIIYLQDYRIYGENKYFKSINYVKKLPFKFYKKSNRKFDNTGLIYITYVCRKISASDIEKYHRLSQCNKTYLVVPYKIHEYNNINGVILIEAPLENIFDKFDIYIYTPVPRKFDCSPRLVTECFILNKKVFKLLEYYDIGLETRYNDCVNNLEALNLKTNDSILDIIT